MSELEIKIMGFAVLLQEQQRERFEREYPGLMLQERADQATKTAVHIGKRYARVDVGTSGKYMVEMDSGNIYGIKAYGVIHRGHPYGNLDTIHEWDWSGYTAVPLPPVTYPAIPQDTLAIG